MVATTTTLGYALLGLLAREPRSGYDLARALRAPIGLFWQARHSQIYPELARLEAVGFVTHERVEQEERPDKKLYAITGAGRAALGAWVVTPLEPSPRRDELALRAYSLWLADPRQALALFREHERHHRAQMVRLEEARGTLEREEGADLRRVDTPQFARYATLQRGIGFEREYADWCRWVAERLAHALAQGDVTGARS